MDHQRCLSKRRTANKENSDSYRGSSSRTYVRESSGKQAESTAHDCKRERTFVVKKGASVEQFVEMSETNLLFDTYFLGM